MAANLCDIFNTELFETPVMDAVINALSCGEILCCVHCGRMLSLNDVKTRRVIGREGGYLVHISCELRHFVKTNPRVCASTLSGAFSENDLLRGLESEPVASIMESVEKVWSRLSASQRHFGQQKSQRFSLAQSPLIEDRSYYNWEVVTQFIARNAS